MGIYVLENSGSSPVTIQGVSLRSPHGLKVTGVWLLPIYHDPKTGTWDVLGAGFPYPPDGRPNWDKRRPAVGGVIRAHQNMNLVFGVARTTSKPGMSAGPDVVYTADSSSYTWQSNVSFVLADKCF